MCCPLSIKVTDFGQNHGEVEHHSLGAEASFEDLFSFFLAV